MALGERAKPVPVDGYELYLGERRLACLVCEGTRFTRREVLMNTSGMTYLGWDWANKTALGAICDQCGFVHSFMEDRVELRHPEEEASR